MATKVKYAIPTLYAKKAPTTDKLRFTHKNTGKKDLCLYHDEAGKHLACRVPWYGVSIRRNRKSIMWNAQKHNLVWL